MRHKHIVLATVTLALSLSGPLAYGHTTNNPDASATSHSDEKMSDREKRIEKRREDRLEKRNKRKKEHMDKQEKQMEERHKIEKEKMDEQEKHQHEKVKEAS